MRRNAASLASWNSRLKSSYASMFPVRTSSADASCMFCKRLRSIGVIRNVAKRTHRASISAVVSNMSMTRSAVIAPQ
jgi:hypothetical protein